MKNWLETLLLKLLRRRYVVERVQLEPDGQMWRLCWKGYHKGCWFARLDWGTVGWRLTRKPQPEHKMEAGPRPAAWRR